MFYPYVKVAVYIISMVLVSSSIFLHVLVLVFIPPLLMF